MSEIISQRSIRTVIRQYVGNVQISKEAVSLIQDYMTKELHRICEAGSKQFKEERELRRIQKMRTRYRLSGDNVRMGLNT